MIISNSALDSVKTLIITIGASPAELRGAQAGVLPPAYVAAQSGYSDVYNRQVFKKSSFHCPTSAITVQVSNVDRPDETSDADWVDVPQTTENFTNTDWTFRWFRIKGTDNAKVFVNSVDSRY